MVTATEAGVSATKAVVEGDGMVLLTKMTAVWWFKASAMTVEVKREAFFYTISLAHFIVVVTAVVVVAILIVIIVVVAILVVVVVVNVVVKALVACAGSLFQASPLCIEKIMAFRESFVSCF